jgi:hypothetical protein
MNRYASSTHAAASSRRRRLGWGSVGSTAIALAAVVVSSPARGAVFDPNGMAAVSYPANGAQIGQGINLSSDLSSSNVCIVGNVSSMNPGGAPPQVVSVHLKNNKDASSYFSETGVSASAQAQFLLGSGDAKTKYVASHQFSQSNSTISIYATVEQRQYIVPAGIKPNEVAGGPDLAVSSGIQLSRRAVNLASKDIAGFRKECGDGFIAVLIQGAELIGTLTVKDASNVDSSSFNFSGGVSAMGGNVNATVDSAIKAASSNHQTTLDYIQSGGAGGAAATDEASLIKAIQDLPAAASAAPFAFRVIVRDYRTLPNWPINSRPFAQPDALDRIMEAYWRIDSLMNEAEDAQQAPANMGGWGMPRGAGNPMYFWVLAPTPKVQTVATVRTLYDSLSAKRQALATQALSCYQNGNCGPPAVSPRDMYALAVQLPMPYSAGSKAISGYLESMALLGNLVNGFNIEKRALYGTSITGFGTDGNCYYRDHFITQTFEHQGYPANIQNALNAVSNQLAAFPAAFREDVVDFYARQPAHLRCLQDPTDADCALIESDFQAIGNSAPVISLSLHTNFSPDQTYRYGSCPGSIDTTAYLSAFVSEN